MTKMKQTLGILTAAAMLSQDSLSSGAFEGTHYSSLAKREPQKTQLSKKQQKVRAKNKAAKKARKKNR